MAKKRVKRPARYVLLDRDGVINEYVHDAYVNCWEDFKFIPGALDALKLLADAKFRVILISNQAGVGRGFLDKKTLDDLTNRMIAEIKRAGGRIDDVFYCLHAPADNCECRKPKPGLILAAARKHKFELSEVCFIGDNEADIQAARTAGCGSILVLCGKSKAADVPSWPVQPDRVETDLLSAVKPLSATTRRTG